MIIIIMMMIMMMIMIMVLIPFSHRCVNNKLTIICYHNDNKCTIITNIINNSFTYNDNDNNKEDDNENDDNDDYNNE